MMVWTEFIGAMAVFFLSHAVPVRPKVKPWLVRHLGARGFSLIYSILSLMILIWLIVAAGRAPFVPLWEFGAAGRHTALTLMLIACLVLALGIARPNPFSFGGAQNDRFDPAHPGIVRLTRHPLLLALALWGGAHVLANGDLAHVVLFAPLAGFAVLGGKMITRRKRREMGAEYDRLWAETRALPISRLLWPPSGTVVLRLLAGFLLYGGLILAHGPVIGVNPLF
ncbi:NnrU family protein [Celeribacter sp. HF31]|uniref:NnrU family protein n=1 Tax=Celeribacter sp. HF31 TaxID=2721558 RepID=UPI0034C6349F